MIFGSDFDNTIVCYDGVFHRIAVEQDLIPQSVPATKQDVRDYLRDQGREDVWTELQGFVYGARMDVAKPYAGVVDFFRDCQSLGVETRIVSHKTRHPFIGPQYDLHRAAKNWLLQQRFFDCSVVGTHEGNAFFELTKEEKMARIEELGCTHFIDDLPEFLAEPAFPKKVERWLFDPNCCYVKCMDFKRFESWNAVNTEVCRLYRSIAQS
jgi:hypothetical protein